MGIHYKMKYEFSVAANREPSDSTYPTRYRKVAFDDCVMARYPKEAVRKFHNKHKHTDLYALTDYYFAIKISDGTLYKYKSVPPFELLEIDSYKPVPWSRRW